MEGNNLKNLFVVNDMHDVLETDQQMYSHSMNYPVSDPNDLRKPFDKISYKKGKHQDKINLPVVFNTFI